ncbi:P-loop ATPase, Sll1717 family [Flavobacterium hercynium]|uniref:Uncharacterized protein n=1 Tax=Flavobacterium hercynium TaxID=387094 RepID=A0A226GU39_9FLAO|nr:hypothetical protein [Flavobacterium hercynium]OXA85487.1 hypothetical protein B0A66_19625 [Flavobacterium hercynium]SMP16399.1 hypothetical protein SAMN06265346_10533 [Flavobacterium hercynium]
MSFFKKLSLPETPSNGTTKNFFIGTPEAEGELTGNSKMKLGEIFGDYLNVFPELQTEKFVITGRKGAGKSAIAEYIYFTAGNDANVFCDFIKTRDFDSQKIVQIGKENGLKIEEKLLFEWLILTKLTKLLITDQSIKNNNESKDLRQFLDRNSGLIDIKSYEISEIVKNNELQVNIEYFKRAFTSLFKKSTNIKEHKAPFYKILPHLNQVVIKLLKENFKKNEFILIFDDLDIGFKENDEHTIESITNILRVAKDYNIDFFGKNDLNCKVVILLRDDIKRIVVKYNADTAKLFSSYEIPLTWYEHENFKTNENTVGLKQLINKRIAINFERENIEYLKNDPWSTLIKTDYQYNGSSFKYVIEHTFFKPRDLILFFKALPQHAFKIPLNYNDVQKLLYSYIEEQMLEVRNELSSIFNPDDITTIFIALKNLKQQQPLEMNDLIEELIELDLQYDPMMTLLHLFNYSLIGNIENIENGQTMIYFKHREKRGEPLKINFEANFIYHKILEVYLKNM